MNEIEVSPQENEERLGSYLKSAREGLKMSLEEISNETKIRKFYLECFEENDLSPLPADVISRGFLKAVAISLKLDPEHVLTKFDQEKGIFQLDEVMGDSSFRPTLKNERRSFLNGFYITIFLLLLLVVIYIFMS
tara:strand:- start:8827 stop:9231 length:405 start_codon:yes stop_codon:yes gene_type:complete